MCGCSPQWWKWKQILEWMKVTTAWFTASATILTSAFNIKISTFKLNYLYTLVICYLHLLQVWSGRFTKDYDHSFILIGAATEAAQPKPVLQYQSMSASTWSVYSGWFTCSYPTRVFMQSIISYESKWMKFMTFYNLITCRPSRTHGRSAYSVWSMF